MKSLSTLLVTCMLLALGTNVQSQKTVHQFIDQLKEQKGAYALTLPGWFIKAGLNIAFEEDIKDTQGYQDIRKGIKQLRLAIIPERGDVPAETISKLVSLSKEKDGMEEYIKVRDNGQEVIVLMKEQNEVISNLTIVSNGDDQFAIVNLKTNITLEALKNANFSFNKKNN